jgi:hypothetical protein
MNSQSSSNSTKPFGRWLVVILFATAMAWVEAAVVFYLRTMINRIEPYQPNPLPQFGGLAPAELVRELATLIMLSTVGWLAGTNRQKRVGYALIAFGAWDVFYYVFLKVLTPWPHSLLDWDILFLLPLPWWGPVLAPVCIAVLMIFWGTLVTQFEREGQPICSNWKAWALSAIGAVLALYLFMEDAIRVSREGTRALRELLPSGFHWPLFCMALCLMATPIMNVLWKLSRPRSVALALVPTT